MTLTQLYPSRHALAMQLPRLLIVGLLAGDRPEALAGDRRRAAVGLIIAQQRERSLQMVNGDRVVALKERDLSGLEQSVEACRRIKTFCAELH